VNQDFGLLIFVGVWWCQVLLKKSYSIRLNRLVDSQIITTGEALLYVEALHLHYT